MKAMKQANAQLFWERTLSRRQVLQEWAKRRKERSSDECERQGQGPDEFVSHGSGIQRGSKGQGKKGGRKSSGKEKRKSVLKRPTLIASPIDGPEMSRVRMRLLLRGLRLPNVSM